MIQNDLTEKIGRQLALVAQSSARVFLFGSAARQELTEDSDLDFLVIEQTVPDRIAEATRLRHAIGDVGVPVDIVVIGEELAKKRAKVPGTMVYHAIHEGRLIAQS